MQEGAAIASGASKNCLRMSQVAAHEKFCLTKVAADPGLCEPIAKEDIALGAHLRIML